MSFLYDLPSQNRYLFWILAGVLGLAAAFAAFKARTPTRRQRWKVLLIVLAIFLVSIDIVVITTSRSVGDHQVGIGPTQTFESGVHPAPRERFVRVNLAGSFIVPYPNEEFFLIVEYQVTDPKKLVQIFGSLLSHESGLPPDSYLGARGAGEGYQTAKDPLAVFLHRKVRERCPTSPGNETSWERILAPTIEFLSAHGITGQISLGRKNLIKAF